MSEQRDLSINPTDELERALAAHLAATGDAQTRSTYDAVLHWLSAAFEMDGLSDETIEAMNMRALADDLIRRRREG